MRSGEQPLPKWRFFRTDIAISQVFQQGCSTIFQYRGNALAPNAAIRRCLAGNLQPAVRIVPEKCDDLRLKPARAFENTVLVKEPKRQHHRPPVSDTTESRMGITDRAKKRSMSRIDHGPDAFKQFHA